MVLVGVVGLIGFSVVQAWYSYRPVVAAVCRDYPALEQDRAAFKAHEYPFPFMYEKMESLANPTVAEVDSFVVGWEVRTPQFDASGNLEKVYYEYTGPDGWYDVALEPNPKTGMIEIWPPTDHFGAKIRCE